MNITDYIPFGRKNAITRDRLSRQTGLTDREARELIEKARRDGTIIINKQDGRGYYQPGPDDVADMLHQYRSNSSRAKSILAQQKHIRKRLRENGVEV